MDHKISNKFLFLLPKAKYQIKISSFITQLKNSNNQIMLLVRVKTQQPYKSLSFLNLAISKFRISTRLFKKKQLLNLILTQLKANTFSSLIEVDLWKELEFKEQDKL